MTTSAPPASAQRSPLSRDRILAAALCYIDQHGLEELSMHKLGAALGVKGMSLYNHVANKDDLLDGVVEVLWSQIADAAPASTDWRAGIRRLAHAIRAVIRRHPNTANLITSQKVMPAPALRCIQAHLATAIAGGLPERCAYALLRTLTTYALGSAQAEVRWGMTDQAITGCRPAVEELLRPGLPDELAPIAHIFCGQSDPDAQFELGLDLMLNGIDTTLSADGFTNPSSQDGPGTGDSGPLAWRPRAGLPGA